MGGLDCIEDSPDSYTLLSMSDSSESKSRVVVIGATGSTGTSIVNGLLRSGNFVRAALKPMDCRSLHSWFS